MTDLFVDLAQGYGSKPLGERIGYIVGVVVVLVIIIWGSGHSDPEHPTTPGEYWG
jgi:hypothetical protein